MPKATLEFNLPEEQEEYRLAMEGSEMSRIVEELDNYLRNQLKYSSHGEDDRIIRAIYQEIRDKLWTLKNE
jgi:hypothetical protein